MLPVFGAALVLAPDLFLSGRPAAEGATGPWAVYLFAAWAALILAAAWIARVLARPRHPGPPPEPPDPASPRPGGPAGG
jgi:hypothetical protein